MADARTPSALPGRLHELKTWPEPFRAVRDGSKVFEIRRNDRGFAVGDLLVLREWDPAPFQTDSCYPKKGYTGKRIQCRVAYVTEGRWGLPEGLCVMSLADVKELTDAG